MPRNWLEEWQAVQTCCTASESAGSLSWIDAALMAANSLAGSSTGRVGTCAIAEWLTSAKSAKESVWERRARPPLGSRAVT